MNSLKRFVQLYQTDSRFATEIGRGFIWYHCRVTGDDTAAIPLILRYYKAAQLPAPSAEELAKSFRTDTLSIVCAGDKFRLPQGLAQWFEDKFGEAVFESGVPLFRLRKVFPGLYVSGVTVGASAPTVPTRESQTSVAAAHHSRWLEALRELVGAIPYVGKALAVLIFGSRPS